MSRPYCTLFVGTLEQDSALSVGGNSPHTAVDSPLALDGAGRPVLRGTGLAGALIATLRRLGYRIPDVIASDVDDRRGPALKSSRWRVFNSHPLPHEPLALLGTELRTGVAIRHDTGAAADGALYDVEVLPRGTRWPFLLEVIHAWDVPRTKEQQPDAAALAAAALAEWTRGRCWMGRDVARGLGWMHLSDLTAVRLDTAHLDRWPDAHRNPRDVVSDLIGELRAQDDNEGRSGAARRVLEGADLHSALPPPTRDGRPSWFVDVRGTLMVGLRDDGYGLDGIAVGGHAASIGGLSWAGEPGWPEHIVRPPGVADGHAESWFDPGAGINLTKAPGGALQPYIPGSGLRGPLRHELSRQLRLRNEAAADPSTSEGRDRLATAGDKVSELFGRFEESAALLVQDAYLDGDDWQAAVLQHHAGDEFTGGVFESSKFERMAVTRGTFVWRVVVEAADEQRAEEAWRLLYPALRMAECGHVPVGGAAWRGFGWPRWTVDVATLVQAGTEGTAKELKVPA